MDEEKGTHMSSLAQVVYRAVGQPAFRLIGADCALASGKPGRRRMSPHGMAYCSWRMQIVGILVPALLSFASIGFSRATFGQQNPKGPAGPRILEVLQDKDMTAAQKCQALARVQGKLTGQEAATVASWLRKANGRLFVGIAMAMKRCGARAEALSACTAIVSKVESPVDQWGPAMYCLEYFWVSMKQAKASLLERLRHPLSKEQLVGVLSAREMVWHSGNMWMSSEEVFQQLCALLDDDSREVRTQAAMALTQTQNLEFFSSSSAILGLAKAVLEASPPEAFRVNGLLRGLIGVGPDAKNPEAIKAFWTHWLQKEGKGFRLALYALEKAKSSAGMSRREKILLARQVESSIGELPKEDCTKVWTALRKVFEEDTSPPADRCAAWLYPLILIAAKEECKGIRAEALTMLLRMLQDKDPILRDRALVQIGNLPGTTRPGSPSREILDHVFLDAKARPEERARAAWSLRQAAKGEPDLVGKMVTLGESFKRLPDRAFTKVTRTRCIGLVCAALTAATGRSLSVLSLDPSEWRKALAASLPPEK